MKVITEVLKYNFSKVLRQGLIDNDLGLHCGARMENERCKTWRIWQEAQHFAVSIYYLNVDKYYYLYFLAFFFFVNIKMIKVV